MWTRRAFLLGLTPVLVALLVVAGPVLAEELIGTIKSVNADAKTFVVTPKDKEEGVEITINDDTTIENSKGKVYKKFSLERLNPGGQVVVTHEKGIASKVVLKKGAAKKKGQ